MEEDGWVPSSAPGLMASSSTHWAHQVGSIRFEIYFSIVLNPETPFGGLPAVRLAQSRYERTSQSVQTDLDEQPLHALLAKIHTKRWSPNSLAEVRHLNQTT
jgi:hypothetical protein